jgi:ABC-type transport system substrate-binding protein
MLCGSPEKRPTNFIESVCENPDPSYFPGAFLGSKNLAPGKLNLAAYAPPVIDTLMAEGVVAPTSKRLAIYTKLLQRVAADAAYVPLFSLRATAALSGSYTWPSYSPLSYFSTAWALGIKKR